MSFPRWIKMLWRGAITTISIVFILALLFILAPLDKNTQSIGAIFVAAAFMILFPDAFRFLVRLHRWPFVDCDGTEGWWLENQRRIEAESQERKLETKLRDSDLERD